MLHLRRLGLLQLDALTVTGESLDRVLDWWEASPRRRQLRQLLNQRDDIDPDDVIMNPDVARSRGLTSTVAFPRGNLAPDGAVIKNTSIDSSVVDAHGVYRKIGPARVFTSERAAVAAIKSRLPSAFGRAMFWCSYAPDRWLRNGRDLSSHIGAKAFVLRQGGRRNQRRAFQWRVDGACVGHVGPEALAGGPIGKVRDGDTIQIIVDRNRLVGSVDLGRGRWSAVQSRARCGAACHTIRAGPTWPRTRHCLTTLGYGRHCRMQGVALGAAACTTWSRFCVSCCNQGSGFRVRGSEAAWVTPTMMG